MTHLVFIDTETVTLDRGDDVIWEIGAIVRRSGAERVQSEWRWQLRPDLAKAHPRALEVGRFHQRYELDRYESGTEALGWAAFNTDGEPARLTYGAVATVLTHLLDGAVLLGSGPWFDADQIALFLRRFNLRPCWHHRLVDVKAEAAGYLKGQLAEDSLTATARKVFQDAVRLPYDPDKLWPACGVELPGPDERHTALGDARAALRLYDAITGGTQ